MPTTIYYYTATGNSLDVAREIAAKTGDAKLVNLVPLAGKDTVADGGKIGIVFPVYDWNMPLVVRDFLTRLDVSGAKYVFAVATCNYLPGQSLERVREILEAKGGRLNAGFVVHMPGTYLLMYGANSKPTQASKFAAKVRKAGRIAEIIRAGKDSRVEKSPVGIDRLLGPKMEKHMAGFPEMDEAFTLEPGCNGCGTCERVCPFGNIAIKDGRPEWLHKCQQCFACIHLCAKGCIEIGQKTKGKKRYKNPEVSVKELIALASEAKPL
jgi:ferredoxin/flavodoxin